MNRIGKPNKQEGGITLIVLIITIVILLILTTVVITSITGNDGLVNQTISETEDYTITQYAEQIHQLERQIIAENAILGIETNLESIVAGMREESTWIKDAIVNVDGETTNPDIVVTTTDGYVYQVFYDETYGVTYVEYIGEDNDTPFPEVLATYNRDTSEIEVIAREDTSGIANIELMYGGEVINSSASAQADFKIDETGWYKVKVTSNSGKLRYAWLKVTKVRSTCSTNNCSNKRNN